MMRCMATPVGARLGAALRATYEDAGVSQEQLADGLGVDQTTISGWARGMRRVPLDALEEIERICRVRKGTILGKAGYVDPGVDVLAAIAAASDLDETGKRIMTNLYGELRLPDPPGGRVVRVPPSPVSSQS